MKYRFFSYETDGSFGIGKIYFNNENNCFEFIPILQIKIDFSERLFRNVKEQYENWLCQMDLPDFRHYKETTFEKAFEIEKTFFEPQEALKKPKNVVYNYQFLATNK